MAQNIIQANNITKFFSEDDVRPVIQNVSFGVERGTFASITGKSGSGKSTLMYLLSTMDTNYTGSLYMDGVLLTGQSPDQLAAIRNRSIGFVFQFHYLLSNFTVLQNVMLPGLKLAALPTDEIEFNAMEKLRLLGIQELALKQAHKISGGQQQRVAIARALINNPMIIFGDEPTGNLDSYNSQNVIELFRAICTEQGQTIIVVTHDESFAKATDRIINLTDGQIDLPEIGLNY